MTVNRPKQIMMSNISLVLAGAALLATVTVGYYTHSQVKGVQEQLAMTPPTVVVDFGTLVNSYGSAQGEALEQRMLETRNKVLALKEAGYLVLDAANIVAAPDDIYLPAEPGQGK